METVGQRLKRLRLAAGLSQRQLGEPGVSYAYISRIEAGTRSPSVKALRRLAPKLNVSVYYLEHGIADPDRERARRLLELAKLWRGIAFASARRVVVLEQEGKETPDPTTIADALVDELRKLNERVTNEGAATSRLLRSDGKGRDMRGER